MKTSKNVLLNVSYSDETGKWFAESYIKNSIVPLVGNSENNIHETVAVAMLDKDGMIPCYNGKPWGNVFVDGKDGEAIPVGYHYRVKNEYMTDERGKNHTVFFTAWVSVKSIREFPIVNIEQ
jgi:hypothetical protein